MIAVHGREGSEEYRAAESLRDLMLAWCPSLESDPRHRVWIVSEAQCYGQTVQDLDLVVFAVLGGSTPLHVGPRGSARFRSLCFTVEVKTHSRSAVDFRGKDTWVRYGGEWKCATKQSEQQELSLRKYVGPKVARPPFCVDLLWLRNVSRGDLPPPEHNIVSGEADWDEFLSRLRDSRMSPRAGSSGIDEVYDAGSVEGIEAAAKLFTEHLPASRLDRVRMERVSERWLKTQQYGEKLGEQLLIFRGRGGTGKTAALLRMAHDIHQSYGQRILILTYHRALVSDLTRLFALMSLSGSIRSGGIRIRTVHSFIRGIAIQLAGYTWNHDNEFGAEYELCKQSTADLLGAVLPEDIQRLKSTYPEEFDWDYVFIDEAQDWPADERDILYRVYDPRTFVLADGVDQYIRSNHSIDWTVGTDRTKLPAQRVPLRKVLRLKAGLCGFVQTMAEKLGLDEWNVEANLGAQGGRIVVVVGSYFDDRSLHDGIVEANARDGNEPVDMLFCVPADDVERIDSRRTSSAGAQFERWGYKIWDGVDPAQRDSFPTDLGQLRIVQYDSCRGLEGWTVVNLGFDRFFDLKRSQSLQGKDRDPELFFDPQEAARRYAAQWLMIPLTRAIDTLVIEIGSVDHPVGRVLQQTAAECGAIVEWVNAEPPAANRRRPAGERELQGFQSGDTVIHTIYGKGKIRRLWRSREGPRAEVEFGKLGKRTIPLIESLMHRAESP
jgi:hypothetical protein